MNTISILTKSKAILKGWTRVALNIQTPLMQYREENYCKKCPVSHKDGKYQGTCLKENGGCGCGISAKTRQSEIGCPKGFFANDWFKPEDFEKFIKEQEDEKAIRLQRNG